MKLRHTLCMVLALIVFSSIAVYAIDLDENLPPDIPAPYTGVASIGATLSINSVGKATCSGYVNLKSGYTASATLSLQQKQGSSWFTIISWSATGGPTIAISKSYYVASGYSYRVVMTAAVYDNNSNYVETVSATSTVVYY